MHKRIFVSLEHRFYTDGQRLFTKLSFPYSYWADYLTYFDEVVVVARVQKVQIATPEMVLVDGPSVSFVAVPYYVGSISFLRRLPALLWAMAGVAARGEAFLLRSGNVSNLLWLFLVVLRKPYLREYPGNVEQGVLGVAGTSKGTRLLAKFLHHWARVQGRFSIANSFVSEYCRELYGTDRPSYVFSSFCAEEVGPPKASYAPGHEAFRIVSVGRLEGEKGHHFLISALSAVPGCSLEIIGDGRQRMKLEAEAPPNVEFRGAVTDRSRLFDLLRASDLFILPSLTDGMPRALLEAMALGLPCLGSNVGGVPEVLPSECLFAPGNSADIATKIVWMKASLEVREAAGRENLAVVEAKFGSAAARRLRHDFWSRAYG